LVEDNPGDAALVSERLEESTETTFGVTQARRLSEALTILSHESFDLVLLDLGLPDSSGLETFLAFSSSRHDGAIVVLTGNDDAQLRERIAREGATDFLIKRSVGLSLPRTLLSARERHRTALWRRQLEALVTANPDALLVVDSAGVVLFANPNAQEMLGRGDVKGQRMPFSLRSDTSIALLGRGGVRHCEVRAAPIRWSGKDAWLASIRDETESRRLTEELSQQQKLDAVGRLAGGVAHEFDPLMSAILRCSQSLRGSFDSDDPRVAQVLEISTAAERARDVTQQLSTFSRRVEGRPILVDVSEAVLSFRQKAKRILPGNVEVTTSLTPRACFTRIDPAQLDQVLLNLTINAGDAMLQGGTLHFATRIAEVAPPGGSLQPGSYVCIDVTDTGGGIPQEDLTRVFEPFFSTAPKERGSGLGLAACYGILRRADGDIAVRSLPGRGATFTLRLPAREAHSASHERPAVAALRLVADTRTLLLVEDDAALRRATARVLRRVGYRVVEAVDGQDALRIIGAREIPLSLVVTDLRMPRLNGAELAEIVHRDHPRLPLLLLTGYDDGSQPIRTSHRLLTKPFDPGQLVTAVEELLKDADEQAVQAV
jgi:signal transduction histidine kinase